MQIQFAKQPTLRILLGFAWFCSKQNRDRIKFITGNLKKDSRAMQQERRSEMFIQCVLVWHVIITVLSVTWGGFRRFLVAILPIGKIISLFLDR